jgi:predicted CXXCH cytochrome family protein
VSGALPSERLAVPLGLARSSRLYPALPRWAKLGRPFHGLSVEILWCFVVCILSLAAPALAADHRNLPAGSECLSCHAERTKGQSVHFDFAHACTVCHVVSIADGKTSIMLVLPKDKICYSCHEKAAMDEIPYMKGECLSCHDPHNSQRTYLLRPNVPLPTEKPKP